MAVFVDELRYYRKPTYPAKRHGHWWGHLLADTTVELHAFAAKLKMSRSWFQDHHHPHYDLTILMRSRAVAAGATRITVREWIKRCQSQKHYLS